MESLNQEILKQLLQCRHHRQVVKATVEFDLKGWIEKSGHIDFFCTNQKQVTFRPMTSYVFDLGHGVVLCDERISNSFECQKIMLDEIRNLFQLYFDRVTEETKQKFDVKVEDSLIVISKIDSKAIDEPVEEVKGPIDPKPLVKKAKSPSKVPKTKAKAKKDHCDCDICSFP